jgi:hypothetical protein
VRSAVISGCAYFALVFAIGFLLGTLRVLVLSPRIGDALAVLAELPVILAASWIACGWLISRFAVPTGLASRAVMGGVAFCLLMVAEIGVSVLGFERSISDHLASYQRTAGLLGFTGQIAFALFPMIQSWVKMRGTNCR